MKIGVLLAVYNDPAYVEQCLKPWIDLKRILNIKIAVCHGQFKEYHDLGYEDSDELTQNIVGVLHQCEQIDYLYYQNPRNGSVVTYQNEAELRNHGLQYLLDQNVDVVWTIGSDELYTELQIINIVQYIKKNDLVDWYRVNYKNFVFDKKHYIKGFNPARIWWTKRHGGIDKFYWDDDILYKDGSNYLNLSHLNIPETVAFVNHYTWCDPEIAFRKIEYQNKHFANNLCSYKIQNGKIVFNEEYYKTTGQTKPEVYND